MSNPYLKDFDTILSEVLTDYKNLDEAPNVGEGTMPFIMGSVLSSMLWGLYRYQDYIQQQHFVNSADTENLDKWGVIYGISRITDETDSAYLERILNFLRQPPAGGNKLDFETWAKDDENSHYTNPADDVDYYNAYVTIVENADGVGTVGVYTIPNDETIIDVVGPPNLEELLRAATNTYIETVRPLGLLSVAVTSAKPELTTIVVSIKGDDVDETTLKQAILDKINGDLENSITGMAPGESLHKSTIIGVCLDNGAEYATVSTPATDETTIVNTKFYRLDSVASITVNYL